MMNTRTLLAMALLTAATFASGTAQAFEAIPKDSARALGVTRGRAFSDGAVFINGKYLPPPYVVERWGTGIRINGTQATGQVVDWTEFAKDQPDITNRLLRVINNVRTDVDRVLRAGGFICFGDNYSKVIGDRRTLMTLLSLLPEMQLKSDGLNDFKMKTRDARLSYLNDHLREDLYRNRIDGLQLRKRREAYERENKLKDLVRGEIL